MTVFGYIITNNLRTVDAQETPGLERQKNVREPYFDNLKTF